MVIPGITLIEAQGVVTLQCEPTIERPQVDAAALRQFLLQSGYGEWLAQPETIDKAVADCNKQESAFSLALAQKVDATVKVVVDADEMTAQLTLTPPYGGVPVSMVNILQALDAAGVVFGIDESAIGQACEAGQCIGAIVAQGQPVQHGHDSEFEEMVAQTVNRVPTIDGQGLIDYRERGSITVVQPGAPLMRRTPASAGVAGRTVRGVVVMPQPGRDAPFATRLGGAKPASNDPNLLEATISGQPVRVDCGVNVEPVFEVAEVNMASGNIHFDGTVHVLGDVIQGMKVEAGGDIVVDGMVEGAELRAGGDIRVAGGVIAHAWLHAGLSVSARFAEGAHISAGGAIVIGEMALECELESLNQIVIGAASPKRGRLVGGSATAMMLISVPILSSANGGLTKVTLGVNAELDEKWAVLAQRIEKEESGEKGLEKLVKQLTVVGDPKNLLARVKATRQHALDVLGRLLVERAELQEQIAQASLAKLTISAGVAGAVDLTMGKLVANLRGESDAGAFTVDPAGHIMFTDRHGSSIPATWLGSKPASMLGSD